MYDSDENRLTGSKPIYGLEFIRAFLLVVNEQFSVASLKALSQKILLSRMSTDRDTSSRSGRTSEML